MKECPYNLKIEQVAQETHEYSEARQETFRQHKLVEVQRPTPCTGKTCGVYRFGGCRRRE